MTDRDPAAATIPASWVSFVRIAALAMAIAAEPSWAAGQWVALVGSSAMQSIALGITPDALIRAMRSAGRETTLG